MIPAGLIDSSYEFLYYKGHLMFLHAGRMRSFNAIPEEIRNKLTSYINSNPEISQALDGMGLIDQIERLRKFVQCHFGSLDSIPDIAISGDLSEEYVNCPARVLCKYEGILCSKVKAAFGYISFREIEVIQAMSQDLPNKMIADQLGITTATVSTHIQNIHSKTGCHSKYGIIAWASQNNLI